MGAYEYPFDLGWARNSYPDGQSLAFSDVGVTAGFYSHGFVYVEKSDRSSGIRVATEETVLAGSRVNVVGTMRTDPLTGERYIDADPSYPQTCGRLSILPLGMSHRSLGGGSSGLQIGVTGGTGANNIGILARIWGKVLSTAADHFIIDDGCEHTVKCAVPAGVPMPQEREYVSVTGISTCEVSGSQLLRLVLIRDKYDIVTFSP